MQRIVSGSVVVVVVVVVGGGDDVCCCCSCCRGMLLLLPGVRLDSDSRSEDDKLDKGKRSVAQYGYANDESKCVVDKTNTARDTAVAAFMGGGYKAVFFIAVAKELRRVLFMMVLSAKRR